MTLPVEHISKQDLEDLTRGTQLIERSPRGDKVRLTSDSHMIKFFYLKRRFSSALIDPYACRFCRNADALRSKGISTVKCERILLEPEQRIHVAIYPMVPGKPLRQVIADAYSDDLLIRLAGYISYLHDLGVYFRSVHFNNILVLPDGEFGLIDISDLYVKRGHLNMWHRARNFRHIMHDATDRETLHRFGLSRFVRIYLDSARLSSFTRKIFCMLLSRVAPEFQGICRKAANPAP